MHLKRTLPVMLVAGLSAVLPAEDKGLILDLYNEKILNNFQNGAQGWTFETVPAAYSEPIGAATNGALAITASSNVDNYGTWASPIYNHSLLDFSPFAEKGVEPTENLFRMRWSASGNVANADMPSFRMRTSLPDFSMTWEITRNSVGSGSQMPGGNGAEYVTLISHPSSTRYRHFFDLLGFDATNSANATVALDQFVTEDMGATSFGTPAASQIVYNFAGGNANGFTFDYATGGNFGPAYGFQESGGLAIYGRILEFKDNGEKGGVEPVRFGFWERDTGIQVVDGRLYKFDFTMRSTAPPILRSDLPTFRLRINDSTFATSSLLNVESISNDSFLPVNNVDYTYTVYWYAPDNLDGATLRAAFDYLYVPGSGNNAFRGIIMKTLVINQYQIRL